MFSNNKHMFLDAFITAPKIYAHYTKNRLN